MSDWRRVPIGEVFEVQLGKMLGAGSEYGTQYQYLANRNVQWGRVVIDDLGTMNFSATEREQYRLRSGDLLVCEGGEVGRAALWSDELPECYFQNAIHRLRVTSAISPQFMRHYFEFAATAGSFRALTGQTSIGHLPRSNLVRWLVPVPPLEEQRQIAEILDTIDETIQATERVIAKLIRHREGLEAWLLREGQDAKHVALAEVASVDRGKFSARPRNDPAFYGGKYPFIQTGDVTRAQRRMGIGYAQTLNDLGLAVSRKFQIGTIAVTIAANIADTAILDRPMCLPDSVVGVTVFRPNSTRWIELCIHAAKPMLEARAPQSAQKNINLQDLRPLNIPILDPARQHVLAELWEEQLRLVDREMLNVAKLNRLRSGLAADLLSGRVRTVEA